MYVIILKSQMGTGMLDVAEQAYLANKMRTQTMSLIADAQGFWTAKVWVDNWGKRTALFAHGYEFIDEWEENGD